MIDRSRLQNGSPLFWLIIGAVIGLLVGVLVVPRRQNTVKVAGEAGAGNLGASPSAGGAAATGGGQSGSGPAGGGDGLAGGSTSGAGSAGPGASVAASGASASGGPGAPGGPTGGAAPGAATVPGITATTIRIGIAYPDISALRELGPAYDNGNVPAQFQALIQGYRQQHLLPVGGRDIQLYFASFNVLDANAQNTACRTLVEDDHVFAVIGVEYFETGSDCVARQFHTPLITNDGPDDAAMQSGAPYLISMEPSTGAVLRNWVYWALHSGYLNGKKVGVYYSTADPISANDAQKNVIGTLQKLGHAPVAVATTTDTLGGPPDAIAVQKFRAAGVGVALLLTSISGFLQQADVQGYHPKYLSSDYLFGTSDTTTSNYQADQWNGTYAIAESTEGASAGGKPFGPGTAQCVDNYNKQTGANVQNPGSGGHETAEWGYILAGCDEGQIMLTGLQRAGSALTAANFLAGIHNIADLSLRRIGAVGFAGVRDWGAVEQRTLLWQANCTCYRAVSDWAPLFTQ